MELLNHRSDHQPTKDLEESIERDTKDLKEIDDAIAVLDEKIEEVKKDLSDTIQAIEADLQG